jgi:Mycothiol maleylpyruvate isomerase N-terminal domain
MQAVAEDFLIAADSALELVGRVEVVQRWDEPSALAEMTVGAVAAHLGSQVLTVHAAVTAGHGASDEVPVPLLEHYSRVPWVRSGIEDESNARIRLGAERSAGSGHDALTASMQRAIQDLRRAFPSANFPARIRMAGWDWSLSFDDFLVTRVMEIVVHSDDLAVSVGIEPPTLPEALLGPVLALLVGVSLQRHGQAALVRALSRRERAPETISAF